MEFTLTEQFGALAPAEQKQQILATNQDAWTSYGLQLTPDEAGMIMQTAEKALRAQDLVQFGEGITPRLIHWFLPSGYLGRNYAMRVAALTEAFYQIKGSLQALYDEADDPECVLSDNAILDYMYRFYISPTCAGDTDEMLVQTERIVVGGMRRLLEYRAAQRKAAKEEIGDPELRMLYADKLQQEELMPMKRNMSRRLMITPIVRKCIRICSAIIPAIMTRKSPCIPAEPMPRSWRRHCGGIQQCCCRVRRRRRNGSA